ncbi:MAG: hypothetical protein AAF903_12285 [Pseudomonadota bacterium]
MSNAGFDTIPGDIVAPIITFEVNSGGTFTNESRGLVIAPKSTDGTMDQNVPYFPANRSEARQLAGKGSILSDMYRRFSLRNALNVWMMSVADVGTAQQVTVTINTAATGTGRIQIAGQMVTVGTDVDDTPAAIATALAAAINSYYDPLTEAELPYTATAASAVVTLTARHKGVIFEGVDIWLDDRNANSFIGNVTIDTPTAGAGDPNLSAPLAAIDENNWDWIYIPFSDDANFARYEALLSDVSGRWAWSKQLYGHVFTAKRGSTAEITTYLDAKDTRHVSTVFSFTASGDATPIWGVLAEQMAPLHNWLSDGTGGGVTRAHDGLPAEGHKTPRVRASWPDYNLRNTLLKLGGSVWRVNNADKVVLSKVVTHHKTENDAPDATFRDIQSIAQLTYGLRRIRAQLAFEHSNRIAADDDVLSPDLPASTTRDVEATLVQTYTELVEGGVFRNTQAFTEAVRVTRDNGNPNRYNIFAPILRGVPLDIIAANATIYQKQIPAA